MEANVLRAFLTDFGLAKSVATGSKLTRTGVALGTPAYMSPEQAQGEVSSLAPATDVWSLGCVLYEMLAGRPPWRADTPAALVGKILLEPPAPLPPSRPGAPNGIGTILRVALAKSPGARYAAAAGFRDDLDRLRRGDRPRARAPASPWPRRLALAALVAGAAWAIASRSGAPGTGGDPRPRDAARSRGESLAASARALRASDPRGALRQLALALEAEPSRHDWRVERGLLLWGVGEAVDARREWDAVPEDSSEKARARWYRALETYACAVGERRWSDEELARRLSAAAEGGGPTARLARAAIALRTRDWGGARDLLRDAEGWEAALLSALLETSDPGGDPRKAVRDYDRALDQGPPLAWVHANRGYLRGLLGDFAAAIEDADRALALDPRNAQAYLNRGAARVHKGDGVGAIEDLDRVLEIQPGWAEALRDRGVVRAHRGDFPGAVTDLDSALAAAPGDRVARVERGDARARLGDYAGALSDHEAVLATDPRDVRALLGRSEARRHLGDLGGALADADAAVGAVGVGPPRKEPWMARGLARVATGDLSGGVEDFDRALAIEPRDATALGARGITRLHLGDPAGAVRDLEECLAAAAPDWPNRRRAETALEQARAAAARRGG